jgi:hypothetical protein
VLLINVNVAGSRLTDSGGRPRSGVTKDVRDLLDRPAARGKMLAALWLSAGDADGTENVTTS